MGTDLSGSGDRWAKWVLARGHASDREQRSKKLEELAPIRDRVLANARIEPGEVLLDVGTGDGLIAFAAFERAASPERVILSDISQDLLDHDRVLAQQVGVEERTEFVRASADDLSPIPDASVDVVTTRSVLIYVAKKDAAFREFHRVLRPGGRVSLFEPINNYFPESPDDFWGFDARPVRNLVEKIWAFESHESPQDADDPMMDFTERDLLDHALEAGFQEVHVELFVDAEPGSWAIDWDRLLALAPNPNAKTVGETISGALSAGEAARFEAHIRPLVDAGRGVRRSAFAYLSATKS